MSTQQVKSSKMSSSIDTSHLKVKFPFKSKYGNFIGGDQHDERAFWCL